MTTASVRTWSIITASSPGSDSISEWCAVGWEEIRLVGTLLPSRLRFRHGEYSRIGEPAPRPGLRTAHGGRDVRRRSRPSGRSGLGIAGTTSEHFPTSRHALSERGGGLSGSRCPLDPAGGRDLSASRHPGRSQCGLRTTARHTLAEPGNYSSRRCSGWTEHLRSTNTTSAARSGSSSVAASTRRTRSRRARRSPNASCSGTSR